MKWLTSITSACIPIKPIPLAKTELMILAERTDTLLVLSARHTGFSPGLESANDPGPGGTLSTREVGLRTSVKEN